MTSEKTAQSWRSAISDSLPASSSGLQLVSWDEASDIQDILGRLVVSNCCFVFGGTAKHSGRLAGIAGVDDVLVLWVGSAALRLRNDGLLLSFVPHPADSADAGFVLTAEAEDAATRDWETARRLGGPRVHLVFGLEHGLLLGAAANVHVRHPMFAAQLARALNRGIYRPGDAERLKYEAQAKASVKAEYDAAKGSHRSGAMDQMDVDRVAWALLQQGLQPTIELLREIHGSGSPSALHPKLKVFYGKLVDDYLTPIPPPSVPEPVRLIWEQLVAAARESASAGLQAEEAALATARERVESEAAALAQERTEVASAQRAAEAAATTREAHIRYLEAELAKAQAALAQAQHIIAGDADQLADLRADLRNTRERVEDLTTALTERSSALAELQEAHGLAVSERDRLGFDLDRLTQTASDQEQRLSQAAEARDAAERAAQSADHRAAGLARRLTNLEADRAKDLKALSKANARIEGLITEQAGTRQALSTARAEAKTARALHERAAIDVGKHQTALANALAECQAVKRERDRLADLLGRLGAAPPGG